MITLEEGEALSRAGKGQLTAIVVGDATAKYREIAQRAAQRGWDCDPKQCEVYCPTSGGICLVISASRVYADMDRRLFDFVAIDKSIRPADRVFIASRVK